MLAEQLAQRRLVARRHRRLEQLLRRWQRPDRVLQRRLQREVLRAGEGEGEREEAGRGRREREQPLALLVLLRLRHALAEAGRVSELHGRSALEERERARERPCRVLERLERRHSAVEADAQAERLVQHRLAAAGDRGQLH